MPSKKREHKLSSFATASADCCCRSAGHDNVRRTTAFFPCTNFYQRPLFNLPFTSVIEQRRKSNCYSKLIFFKLSIMIISKWQSSKLKPSVGRVSRRTSKSLQKVKTEAAVMEWVIIEFSQIYLLQFWYMSAQGRHQFLQVSCSANNYLQRQCCKRVQVGAFQ